MKANVKICFYSFKPVQGWRYQVIRLLSWSRHTHAHLEFDTNPNIAIVVTDCGKTKVIQPKLLNKQGATKYYEYSIGCFSFSGEDLLYAHDYPKANSFKIIYYHLIGRYFNMKMPTTCVTFICDYLNFKGLSVPKLYSPKQLWETLHADNNDWRQSQSGQDNTSQVAE